MNFIKRIINFFKSDKKTAIRKPTAEEMGNIIQNTKTEAILEAQTDIIFGVESPGRMKLLSELAQNPSDFTPVVFKYEHVLSYLNVLNQAIDTPESHRETISEALDAHRRNADTILENLLCMMSTQNMVIQGSSNLVNLFNHYFNKILFSGTRSVDFFISTEYGFLVTHSECVQNEIGESLMFHFSIQSKLDETTNTHTINTSMDSLPYNMLEHLFDSPNEIYTMFILEVDSTDHPALYLYSDDARIIEDKCLFKVK